MARSARDDVKKKKTRAWGEQIFAARHIEDGNYFEALQLLLRSIKVRRLIIMAYIVMAFSCCCGPSRSVAL